MQVFMTLMSLLGKMPRSLATWSKTETVFMCFLFVCLLVFEMLCYAWYVFCSLQASTQGLLLSWLYVRLWWIIKRRKCLITLFIPNESWYRYALGWRLVWMSSILGSAFKMVIRLLSMPVRQEPWKSISVLGLMAHLWVNTENNIWRQEYSKFLDEEFRIPQSGPGPVEEPGFPTQSNPSFSGSLGSASRCHTVLVEKSVRHSSWLSPMSGSMSSTSSRRKDMVTALFLYFYPQPGVWHIVTTCNGRVAELFLLLPLEFCSCCSFPSRALPILLHSLTWF